MKKEIEALEKPEQEAIFRIETSWERKGRIQGRIEGKLEGKFAEKVTIAKRLLDLGLSVDEIATATELSREEIEKLRENS